MNTYYELLGLEPGASALDIKKAYFKMIRKYSPEADPEMFQKIRNAYEHLKSADSESDQPVFEQPADPFAVKMLNQIHQSREAGRKEFFRDTCEEAYRYFPDDIQFLYLLVNAQLTCGNTGKAVKNAELLVRKQPDNRWFQRLLAIAYYERGYTNKAYQAFYTAYQAGCRDLDFVTTYAMLCDEFAEYDKGTQILLEAVRQDKKWSKEQFSDLANAYQGLLSLNYNASENHFAEIIKRLCEVFEQYHVYLGDYTTQFSIVLCHTASAAPDRPEEFEKVKLAFDLLHRACRAQPDKEFVEHCKAECIFQHIADDPRIGETLVHSYELHYCMAELDSHLHKYALLDTQLCMIEEREEIIEQSKILKQEYPDFYEKIQNFILKLESETNLEHLKATLQKSYHRLALDCNGGRYYEKYPQEKRKAHGTVINEGTEEEPYVRGNAKIGRNDPCPCGSGKKYKRCCMNKEL